MRTFFLIALLFISGGSFTQAPTLTASVNKTVVQENETFVYKISSNSDCEITAPDFGDLEIVQGPIPGKYSYTGITNGVRTDFTEYSETYYLRATKKGTYPIPPASMKCKMKKLTSGQTLNIKVVEAEAAAEKEPETDHFLKLTATKSSVYVGEPFVISFKFYSTKQPNSIGAIEPGNATGIWRRDLNPNPVNYMMTQEIIKGKRYYVLEVLREVCIPTRPGKMTIDPYYAALIYQVDFFSPSSQLDGKSNSLQIDVKKFPVNMPDDFNGLVGHFNIGHTLDKTSLKEGQVMQLTLTISGTGNLNAFDLPKLNLPPEFTQSDADIDDKTTVGEDGLSGALDYTFLITAEKEGDYEIEPFGFSYFDLTTRSLRQLSIGKISVHVDEAPKSEIDGPDSDGPDVKDTDIHYIHEETGSSFRMTEFFFGTGMYFALLGGPLLLVLGIAFIKRIRSSVSEESKTENKIKSAKKIALKSLDTASAHLKKGEHREALKVLQHTVFTFFMTKLNLSLSGLSQRAITAELEARKIDTALILEFTHTWKQIEMAQYAPVTPENLQDNISGAKKLINELADKI